MRLTQRTVHIPFFDFGIDIGSAIEHTMNEHKQEGYKPQSQHYGFKLELKENNIALLHFEKTLETPDGIPVLFNYVRNVNGDFTFSFVILDFGEYQGQIVNGLEGLEVGESASFELPLT